MKSTLKSVLALVAAVLFSVCAYAQVTTSSITGKITDEAGAVLGAPVVATHIPSGTVFYAVSDKNGSFRVNNITPGGPYTITIEVLGYRKIEYTGVTANLGEPVTINAVLEEESLNLDAAVFVADGKNSNMNINRSGAGTTISQRSMANIPTVSRSLNDVMKLTPQASTNGGGFSVGGGNYRGSSVTVDGAAFNNAFGIGSNLPAGGSPVSLDAIEQMSVNITPFDVRQSGFTGGAINAVTKSGTNEFHASVYNYYTSDKFKGTKVGENEFTLSKSLENTTGFTVGGPIIKNKLFFFINGEYSLDSTPGSVYEARPDANTAWGSGTNYNRPTVAELDEIASYFQQKFGYNPGIYQGYSIDTPDYKILARLDWNINDNNRLNVRFSNTHNYYSTQPSSSMSPIGGTDTKFTAQDGNVYSFNRNTGGRQSQTALYYKNARYYQEQNFLSTAAELNSRLFDGKGNNMFRFTWSHQYEPRSFDGATFPTVDILQKDEKGAYSMFTTVGIDPFTYGNLRDVNTFIVTDEFTYSTGKHNLIGGLQYEWNRAKNGFMQGGAGWYVYESFDAFKADVENPATAAGPNMFMITHANLDDPTQQAFPTFDYAQASLYAQDEIEFSNYFKLTAGVRFELPFMSFPYNNFNKDFASAVAANPNSSLAGLSTDNVMSNKLAISPRIGFNWDVLKNRKLVVRGGSGIYTGRIPFVWLVSSIGNSNVMQYQPIYTNALNSGIHFTADRSDIINMVWANNNGWDGPKDLPAPTGGTFIDPDMKMPSTWKSSLSVDVELPWGIKGSLEGIYSYGFNEFYATTVGYKAGDGIQLPGEPEKRGTMVAEGIKNSQGKTINGYHAQNVKNLHGQYYSITAQLSKTFDFGLNAMVAYTKSGSTALSDGNGDQLGEFANIITKSGSNTTELGYTEYVAPSRLIANLGYDIKEGKHFTTHFGLFFEGINAAYIENGSKSRYTYTMKNVSGGSAQQVLYIPTDAELSSMPFADEANKAAYKAFIEGDKYLSSHRGEYEKRNAIKSEWLNRINFHVAQDFNFKGIAGKTNTIQLALDINNIGNMINSNWGTYDYLKSKTVLEFKNGVYTFTEPVWNKQMSTASTWSMLFSAKYSF